MDIDLFKKEFELLKTERSQREVLWRRAEKQYEGKLAKRTSPKGNELVTVNLNETFKAVLSCAREVALSILSAPALYNTIPVAIDDIETADKMGGYLTWKVKRIPDIFYTLLLSAIYNYVYGYSIGKVFIDPIDYEPISPWDIWIDNAISFSKINRVAQKVYWTKEELLEIRDSGKYDNVADYLVEVKKSELEDIKAGKSIKKNYEGIEYWYRDNKKDWRILTLGLYNDEPISVFRDIDSPYWFGHQFAFGLDLPDYKSLYGLGEADVLYEVQKALNMVFNLNLDYLTITVRPPIMFEPDVVNHSSELDPISNPELGGLVPVNRIGGIEQFKVNPLSPYSVSFMNILQDYGETLSGHQGTLRGEETQRGEPLGTTLSRTALARKALTFRLLLFGHTLLKTMGEKFLIGIQQKPPKDEIVKILGREGEEWVKVTKGNETKFDGNTFTIGSSKKEARMFKDIEIVPALIEKGERDKVKDLVDILQFLPQMFTIFPDLRNNVDGAELLRQLFKLKGLEIERLFKKTMTPEKAVSMLQKLGIGGGMGGGQKITQQTPTQPPSVPMGAYG